MDSLPPLYSLSSINAMSLAAIVIDSTMLGLYGMLISIIITASILNPFDPNESLFPIYFLLVFTIPGLLHYIFMLFSSIFAYKTSKLTNLSDFNQKGFIQVFIMLITGIVRLMADPLYINITNSEAFDYFRKLPTPMVNQEEDYPYPIREWQVQIFTFIYEIYLYIFWIANTLN